MDDENAHAALVSEAFAYFARYLVEEALYELQDLADVLQIRAVDVQALLMGEQQLPEQVLVRLATLYYSYASI